MALVSNDLIQQNLDGKAMLSWLDDEDMKKILLDKEMHPNAVNTVKRLDHLLTELRVIRRRGYAVDNEEIEIGLGCIGAPIKDPSGAMVERSVPQQLRRGSRRGRFTVSASW